MKRGIEEKLLSWQGSNSRKPLILKGARQIGKTFALREFGQNNFKKYHYLNFEESKSASEIFAGDLNAQTIIRDLAFFLEDKIDLKNDLIIFDEIQACPRAITALKYLYENVPQLAICCAGSLLGVTLSEDSFPVGKVDTLNMYPMTFAEFYEAESQQKLSEVLESPDKISPTIHAKLWEKFKIYLITGGLPEVVATYLQKMKENSDQYLAFETVRNIQNRLIGNYLSDIAKHSGAQNALHIERIFRSIPAQLAQVLDGTVKRYSFKGVISGITKYSRLAGALDWLISAGLVIKVPIIESPALPLMAFAKENLFKLYIFDIGILGSLGELKPSTLMKYDFGSYKGFFVENFVAQELMLDEESNNYAWKQGEAEIEFLRDYAGNLVPIEVKSGNIRRARSLESFAQRYHPEQMFILNGEQPSNTFKSAGRERSSEIVTKLPLYFAGELRRCLAGSFGKPET